MGKRRAEVMECDNPACRTPPRVTSRYEPALGYYLGRGTYHHEGGGGPIPAVYACSPECIGPAVEYVIREAEAR